MCSLHTFSSECVYWPWERKRSLHFTEAGKRSCEHLANIEIWHNCPSLEFVDFCHLSQLLRNGRCQGVRTILLWNITCTLSHEIKWTNEIYFRQVKRKILQSSDCAFNQVKCSYPWQLKFSMYRTIIEWMNEWMGKITITQTCTQARKSTT